MEIKVGKSYLDRYDNVWTVYQEDFGFTYPILAFDKKSNRSESYTKEGRWSRHMIAACDLVREA